MYPTYKAKGLNFRHSAHGAFYDVLSNLSRLNLLMLLGNIYISLGCLVSIWLLIIVGKASKYRLDLYLSALNQIKDEIEK